MFDKLNFIIIAFLLTGCITTKTSSKDWYHPNNNQAKMEQDIAECEYEAEKNVFPSFGGLLKTAIKDNQRKSAFIEKCLKVRGYKNRQE